MTSEPRGPLSLELRLPTGLVLPIVTETPAPDRLVIVLLVNATNNSALSDARSFSWVESFRGSIEIDVQHLGMIDSIVCAWLINLTRQAKLAARIEVTNVPPRVRESLRALRLDRIISVRGG